MQVKKQNKQVELSKKYKFFFEWYRLFFLGRKNDKKRIEFQKRAFPEAFEGLNEKQAINRFNYAKSKGNELKEYEYRLLFMHAYVIDNSIKLENFFPEYKTELELKAELAKKQAEINILERKLEQIKSI